MIDLSVLYVEDDEVVRENFTQILQHYFSQVIVADNGKTALELYKEFKPDVAILDISIPYLSGLQLAEKIRQDNDNIQIIMLTAYADQEKLLQAVNLQLFAYLIKPVKQMELDLTLKKVKKKINKKNYLCLAYGYSWCKNEEILYYNNEQIKLSHKERIFIARLCRYPNRYYTAVEIADKIFADDDEYLTDSSDYNNLVQIISRLKKKLLNKHARSGFFIENVYGEGYRIKLEQL
ncbi:MAG: response regulator transcription factor [gamma proteobacterium symbiont of Taylorina sp.]|nr:response regulator transcription factor [gamma proteobacterium symbiont of Taylorina sp.]